MVRLYQWLPSRSDDREDDHLHGVVPDRRRDISALQRVFRITIGACTECQTFERNDSLESIAFSCDQTSVEAPYQSGKERVSLFRDHGLETSDEEASETDDASSLVASDFISDPSFGDSTNSQETGEIEGKKPTKINSFKYTSHTLFSERSRDVTTGKRVDHSLLLLPDLSHNKRPSRQACSESSFDGVPDTVSSSESEESMFQIILPAYMLRRSPTYFDDIVTVAAAQVDKIVLIQSYVRRYLTERSYFHTLLAIRFIQANWRKQVAGRQLSKTQHRDLPVDYPTSRWTDYDTISGNLEAPFDETCVLAGSENENSSVGSFEGTKLHYYSETDSCLFRYVAATSLQTHYRKRQAESVYKTALCQGKETDEGKANESKSIAWKEEKECEAATTIQAFYRKLVWQAWFNQAKLSAVTIQLAFLEWSIKNNRNALLERLYHSAATTIQSKVRMCTQLEKRLVSIGAAVYIQSSARRYSAQRVLTCVQQDIKNQIARDRLRSSIRIQQFVRGYVARRNLRHCTIKAAVIQATTRRYLVHSRLVSVFKQLQCVTLIQCAVRRRLACHLRKRLSIVVCIQSLVRRKIASREFLQLHSSVVIQKFARQCHSKRQLTKLRAENTREKHSVTTIQTRYRGWNLRARYSRAKISAIVIQLAFLEWSARSHQEELLRIMRTSAAIKIQSMIRMRQQSNVWLRVVRAAVVVQSSVRRHNSACQFLQMTIDKKRSDEWATTIQTVYRGYVLRNKYSRVKLSAITIQLTFLEWSARIHLHRRMLERATKNAAATIIQAKIRMRSQRNMWLRLVRATVAAQSSVRRHNSKCKLIQRKLDRNRKDASATNIQTVYRGNTLRTRYSQARLSVIIIQLAFLEWSARTHEAVLTHALQNAAAIAIQSVVRMQQHRATWLLKESAAIVVQSIVRRHHAKHLFRRTRLKNAYRYLHSIIRIQKVLRGHAARTKMNRSVKRTRIQATPRCYLDKSRLQSIWTDDTKRQCAIRIQHMVRRRLARRRSALVSSTTCIQSAVRHYLCFQERSNEISAILIQTSFRCHLAKRRVESLIILRKQRNAVLIQAIIRRFLTCRTLSFEQRHQFHSGFNSDASLSSTGIDYSVVDSFYSAHDSNATNASTGSIDSLLLALEADSDSDDMCSHGARVDGPCKDTGYNDTGCSLGFSFHGCEDLQSQIDRLSIALDNLTEFSTSSDLDRFVEQS